MKKKTKIILISIISVPIIVFLYMKISFEIKDYFISKQVIYWSKNVELNINDFQGEIDNLSDYNISWNHSLFLKTTNIRDAKIKAVFFKNKSWIKDTTDFKEDMRLQKLRFDLYESFARKYNKKINLIKYDSNTSYSDLENVGNAIYDELNKMDNEIFNNELTISEKIELWRPKIDKMLIQYR